MYTYQNLLSQINIIISKQTSFKIVLTITNITHVTST